MSASCAGQSPDSVGQPKQDENDDNAAAEESGRKQDSKQEKCNKNKKKKFFRKNPQAPRRFKSPYILFSISKMEELKKQRSGGVTNVTSISRRIADEWKELSGQERNKWDEVARQDKLRYDAEKRLYTGPWQVSSKRAKKDPTAPKRPPSSFLLYCKTERPRLKRQRPNLKNTEISVLLGEKWKNASPEERNPHILKEQQEREKYKKDIAEWRKRRDEQQQILQKRRSEIVDHFVKTQGGAAAAANNHTKNDENSCPKIDHLHGVQDLGVGYTSPPQWTIPSGSSSSMYRTTHQITELSTPPLVSATKDCDEEQMQQQKAVPLPYTESGFLQTNPYLTFNTHQMEHNKNPQSNNNNNPMNVTQQDMGGCDEISHDFWIPTLHFDDPSSPEEPSSEVIIDEGFSVGASQQTQQAMDNIQPYSYNFPRDFSSYTNTDYGFATSVCENNPVDHSFPLPYNDSFSGNGTTEFDSHPI